MSEIKPALTAEEWARAADGWFYHDEGVGLCGRGGRFASEHGVAALMLHGQPFGFTRQDVEALRYYATQLGHEPLGQLFTLANRIEALLPPLEEA